MLDYLKLNWKYLGGAALLHALFAGIFALTMISMSRNAPPPQLAIQAVVVDSSTLGAASRRQEQKEREQQRVAEQRRQQELEQQRQAQQDQVRRQEQEQRKVQEEQQRLKEQQLQEQRLEQQRQAQEQARQQQEQQRLQAEAQERERQEAERKRQAELERQKKAEAERQRVAEIERRQKEEAERRKAAEDARVQANRESDLQRQLAEEEGLNQAVASGELNAYINLIEQRIQRNWNRPPSARPGLDCRIKVVQAPGGTVLSAQVTECNGDEAVRQSIVTAVQRASPLPPPSNPRLFERNLVLVFKPRD